MLISDIPGGPRSGEILCSLFTIPDGKAKEFSYRNGNDVRDIFIQRVGSQVFAYENICPHAHLPLNNAPGKFTDKNGNFLMCHNHGALFDIKSGQCLGGPCMGRSLTKIEVDLKGGNIIAK